MFNFFKKTIISIIGFISEVAKKIWISIPLLIVLMVFVGILQAIIIGLNALYITNEFFNIIYSFVYTILFCVLLYITKLALYIVCWLNGKEKLEIEFNKSHKIIAFLSVFIISNILIFRYSTQIDSNIIIPIGCYALSLLIDNDSTSKKENKKLMTKTLFENTFAIIVLCLLIVRVIDKSCVKLDSSIATIIENNSDELLCGMIIYVILNSLYAECKKCFPRQIIY